MRTIPLPVICLFFVALFLGGCSSVQVIETWRSSSATSTSQHKKLLIVNLNLDENVRKMYENIVAGEMKDNTIQAVAGHTYVTIKENYKKEDIQTAVRRSGCDAVLTIRGLTSGNQQLHQQGQGSVLYAEGLIPSSWDDTRIATVQVNLYDEATERLIWSATVKASNDDNKFIESRDMGNLLVKLLRQDGMVQP
jgi:hypothetical protein